MTSGIQSIVDTYVKLRRIDALTSLRAHRRKLLAEASDRSHFNFAVAREHDRRRPEQLAGQPHLLPKTGASI